MRNRFHGIARPAGLAAFLLLPLVMAPCAQAAAGYFVLGYGPYAHQSAGASAAVGFDAFVGATNPAKLPYVGTRLDLGMLAFMPYRRITRTGSETPFDIQSKSRNDLFIVPDGAYARRIDPTWSWGVTLYGNGGLNTEYHETTNVPGTNANPERCKNRPGNFFGGCGEAGFDLLQLVVAPTLAARVNDVHSFGVTPLLAYQQMRVYGLQAFEAISRDADKVTNNGYEGAYGSGVRVGWLGRLTPWFDLGATYATKIYMQDFHEYRGLLAGGSFDIPANFSVGMALKDQDVTLALEVHRIFFGNVPALANGELNSLTDPTTPLGDKQGSGFNWHHQTNYRMALMWHATPRLDLRAGFAYGRVPQADSSNNTVTFSMLAPNPALNLTAGFSYQLSPRTEVHFAYGSYRRGEYQGRSAIFQGASEKAEPRVETIYLAWSRHW
ncbi:MAG: long-chain fatty acid transport protein [Panacagrimonas sp.]|nr:outer membrane protein transport protein [Panacagrimonas sp.]MCC2657053.1 long-chain fatty acid transport protein [Panacagrimonas sp.]